MGVVQEAPLRCLLHDPHPLIPPRKGEGKPRDQTGRGSLQLSSAVSALAVAVSLK